MLGDKWTITMSSGYMESFKAKVRFNGNLTLHFKQLNKDENRFVPSSQLLGLAGAGTVEYHHLLTGRHHRLTMVAEVVIITLIVVTLYFCCSRQMYRRYRYQRI